MWRNPRCYIVSRTRVWWQLFSFSLWHIVRVCIQTWQTSLEHLAVYRWTYFLHQLCKMLILPIRSHCEICPLPTIHVFWEGGGADHKFVTLCRKGILPDVCEKPAISHSASSLVWYGWLLADTRPYPFFTKRITYNIWYLAGTIDLHNKDILLLSFCHFEFTI